MKYLIWSVAAVLLAFGAWRLILLSPDARARDAAGRCLLRARVYTDGEGTPQPRRVFGMQNLDEADWTDVRITINGVVTAGPQARQPTGAHVQRLPEYNSVVAAHKVREVPLDDFQSAEGPRWVALTMRVSAATIAATINGEACTYETAVPQPGGRR